MACKWSSPDLMEEKKADTDPKSCPQRDFNVVMEIKVANKKHSSMLFVIIEKNMFLNTCISNIVQKAALPRESKQNQAKSVTSLTQLYYQAIHKKAV